jgi:hypothetical protein
MPSRVRLVPIRFIFLFFYNGIPAFDALLEAICATLMQKKPSHPRKTVMVDCKLQLMTEKPMLPSEVRSTR